MPSSEHLYLLPIKTKLIVNFRIQHQYCFVVNKFSQEFHTSLISLGKHNYIYKVMYQQETQQ